MSENTSIEYSVTNYGFCLKFKGRVCKHDLLDTYNNVKLLVDNFNKPFNVLFDFSDIDGSICYDTSKILNISRTYMIEKGAIRIVILYRSNGDIVDLTKVFNETTSRKRERYVSTMIRKDALINAVRYLEEGIEP